MNPILTALTLLGLLILWHPITPTRGTCFETAIQPANGTVPFKLPDELNPDEMTQPFLVWENSPLTREENLIPKESTGICRCLACGPHMTKQKTLVRFSSIGKVDPKTGLCHLPVPGGGPAEEATREKYQALSNPGRVTLSWVKLGIAPENATLLISNLNGRRVYIARLNLGNDLMAVGSLDPKLPETWLFAHNASTSNASLLENVEIFTFALTREQAFFRETPPLEFNPDETEYRIQLSDGPNSELDLSCKVNSPQREKSEHQNETIFLQLYRKNPFPFKWSTIDGILTNGRDPSKEPLALYLNATASRGLFFACRATASNGDTLIGIVEPWYWPSTRRKPCLPCTVFQGGQQWQVANYELLTMGEDSRKVKVKVAWADVPSWREHQPSSAFITSLSAVEACNRKVGRDLNKRYIGRVVTGGRTTFILNFPEGFTEESVPKVGASPFGRHVKLNESSLRQVLVAASEETERLDELNIGLVCKKTSQLLDLSSFREEPRLMVKMRLKKEGEMMVRPRIQTIFQKVEPKQLIWRTDSDLDMPHLISYGHPKSSFICRYRCRGSNPCPSSHVTINGSSLIRTIDGTIGYSKRKTITVSPVPLDATHPLYDFFLQLGPPIPPPPKTIETCTVAFAGKSYETETFERLSNPCELKLNWRPVSWGAFPNGTLAVVNEVNGGEKVFIGRIQRPNEPYRMGPSFLLGQVANGGIISFVNEKFSPEEVIVNEKVALLTVEA